MSPEFEGLVRAGLLLLAIMALTAVVLAVARKLRGGVHDDTRDANEIMARFRDVYERGGLSDEEFRTIKAKLATELKGETSDSRNAG